MFSWLLPRSCKHEYRHEKLRETSQASLFIIATCYHDTMCVNKLDCDAKSPMKATTASNSKVPPYPDTADLGRLGVFGSPQQAADIQTTGTTRWGATTTRCLDSQEVRRRRCSPSQFAVSKRGHVMRTTGPRSPNTRAENITLHSPRRSSWQNAERTPSSGNSWSSTPSLRAKTTPGRRGVAFATRRL